MATIDQFKAYLDGGGARANQFKVIFNTPTGITVGLPSGEETSFLCKAASLPGQTIPEVTVNFRGRQLFVAGDRTYETWTTTIINDTDFSIRNAMERWMNGINDNDLNQGIHNITNYAADLEVQQLDTEENVLKSYTLRNCWPTAIAAVELSYDTVSEVETFDVTWRFTHFSASGL
jgi:hypothetical protein